MGFGSSLTETPVLFLYVTSSSLLVTSVNCYPATEHFPHMIIYITMSVELGFHCFIIGVDSTLECLNRVHVMYGNHARAEQLSISSLYICIHIHVYIAINERF